MTTHDDVSLLNAAIKAGPASPPPQQAEGQRKIAIIGTHGTRKSTLVHLLVGRLKEQGINAGYLSEVASSCPLPINQKTTTEAQLWIMLTQIQREIELENRPYDYVVLDRCILDNYVYMQRAYDLMTARTTKDNNSMRIGADLLNGWFPTYDYVFKVDIPGGAGLADDGIRDTSSDFQLDVECRLQETCERLTIPNLHHISGSNEARLQKIMEILGRKAQPQLDEFMPKTP